MGVQRVTGWLAALSGGHRADLSGKVRSKLNFGRKQAAEETFKFKWTEAVSREEWTVYSEAIAAVSSTRVPFMLGGGFALAAYTGRWRDTKDVDFYIYPGDRDVVVSALTDAGFDDLFVQRPYDRKWIYRSVRSGVITDIIWSMANQRAQVDREWFDRAGSLELHGHELLIMPPEEIVWCKLYILQRDHCDWTDVFNLLYAVGPKLDWKHLISRVDEDLPLLRAVLEVYGWLCPEEVLKLPGWIWRRLKLAPPKAGGKQKRNHIRLLDSRGWFAALQPPDRKLEV
ncbi:MAG TPA: nucleotidyltransferase family protein [Verrucomicrobiae bacterium]|nr:nucleotidyltransferase family protein [Verrucomicrobiae bacterium]